MPEAEKSLQHRGFPGLSGKEPDNLSPLNDKLAIGMTPEMVIELWGRPATVNTHIDEYGRSEQWVYRTGDRSTDFVYFDSGEVSSIQTER